MVLVIIMGMILMIMAPSDVEYDHKTVMAKTQSQLCQRRRRRTVVTFTLADVQNFTNATYMISYMLSYVHFVFVISRI